MSFMQRSRLYYNEPYRSMVLCALIRPNSTLGSGDRTKPSHPVPLPDTQAATKSRLPKWAAKYSDRFKNNPASHITSFLILHELTAVLPLPILFWFFHSFDWTPESLPVDYLEKGAQAAGKQLEKWGWKYTGDDGSRYVFEAAAAYAMVKLLLPLRVGLSLSLTPMFARRIVVPFTKLFRKKSGTK